MTKPDDLADHIHGPAGNDWDTFLSSLSGEEADELALKLAEHQAAQLPLGLGESLVQSTAERLKADIDRMVGAAALAELDANMMREAILDALELYHEYDEAAAERMAERLTSLSHVKVTTHPDSLLHQAMHGNPDDDLEAIQRIIHGED